MNSGKLYFDVAVPSGANDADRMKIQEVFENTLAAVDPQGARMNWGELLNIPDPPTPAILVPYINTTLAQTGAVLTVLAADPGIHYCSINAHMICYQGDDSLLNGSPWTFPVRLSIGQVQIPIQVILALEIPPLS